MSQRQTGPTPSVLRNWQRSGQTLISIRKRAPSTMFAYLKYLLPAGWYTTRSGLASICRLTRKQLARSGPTPRQSGTTPESILRPERRFRAHLPAAGQVNKRRVDHRDYEFEDVLGAGQLQRGDQVHQPPP